MAGISYAGAALFTVGLLNNAQRILKLAAQPPPPPGMARVDSEVVINTQKPTFAKESRAVLVRY